MNRRSFIQKSISAGVALWVPYVYADRRGRRGVAVKPKVQAVAPTPTETLWLQQTTSNDYYAYTVNCSQCIKNSASRTISKIIIQLASNATRTTYCRLMSASNNSGDQYGTDSIAVAKYTANVKDSWTYTWASNPSVPANDFYVTITTDGGMNCYCSSSNTYEDTITYILYCPTTTARTTKDMAFQIYTI